MVKLLRRRKRFFYILHEQSLHYQLLVSVNFMFSKTTFLFIIFP